MKQNKSTVKKKQSIRSKLIVFFIIFTAVSLLMLFLFQVFFLDEFYENIKVHSVKTAAAEIASAADEEAVEEYIDYWNVKEQFDIRLINSEGRSLLSGSTQNPMWDTLDVESLRGIFKDAQKNGGELLRREELTLSMPQYEQQRPDFDKKRPPQAGENNSIEPPQSQPSEVPVVEISDAVVYALVIDDDSMVVITAVITPVDATIGTLYVQFIIAAVILISFAVLLALVIARKITRPIENISHAAKGLASGEYQSPPAAGYSEAEELRCTLDEAAVELRKNEQLHRELIANVSHDLRTPLTMITGYSEAIRDLPGEDSAENIQVVIDEAHRLTALVNDVLDLSKLQSDTQSVAMDMIDLTQILIETVRRVETMVAKDGYRIIFEYDGDITVCGDELRISQVIYNLLGNALAHTGDDKRVVVTQRRVGDVVRVSVTDTGNGIPEDELDSIWQRYYQVHSEGHRRHVLNSGLGLSIVKTLVARHGGVCGVDSTVGQGSTFWFELSVYNNR